MNYKQIQLSLPLGENVFLKKFDGEVVEGIVSKIGISNTTLINNKTEIVVDNEDISDFTFNNFFKEETIKKCLEVNAIEKLDEIVSKFEGINLGEFRNKLNQEILKKLPEVILKKVNTIQSLVYQKEFNIANIGQRISVLRKNIENKSINADYKRYVKSYLYRIEAMISYRDGLMHVAIDKLRCAIMTYEDSDDWFNVYLCGVKSENVNHHLATYSLYKYFESNKINQKNIDVFISLTKIVSIKGFYKTFVNFIRSRKDESEYEYISQGVMYLLYRSEKRDLAIKLFLRLKEVQFSMAIVSVYLYDLLEFTNKNYISYEKAINKIIEKQSKLENVEINTTLSQGYVYEYVVEDNKNFGFIAGDNWNSYYFNNSTFDNNVLDKIITAVNKRETLEVNIIVRGNQPLCIYFYFSEEKNFSEEKMMSIVKALMSDGGYKKALDIINHLINVTGTEDKYLELKVKCEKGAKDRTLPRGKTHFARAKRFEVIEEDFEKAIEFYKKAVNENDRVYESAIKVVKLLKEQGRDIESIEILEKAMSMDKTHIKEFENVIISVYKNTGQIEKAVEKLSVWLNENKSEPEKEVILFRIAKMYTEAGKYSKALNTYKQVKNYESNPSILKKVADLYIKLEKFSMGQEYITKIKQSTSEISISDLEKLINANREESINSLIIELEELLNRGDIELIRSLLIGSRNIVIEDDEEDDTPEGITNTFNLLLEEKEYQKAKIFIVNKLIKSFNWSHSWVLLSRCYEELDDIKYSYTCSYIACILGNKSVQWSMLSAFTLKYGLYPEFLKSLYNYILTEVDFNQGFVRVENYIRALYNVKNIEVNKDFKYLANKLADKIRELYSEKRSDDKSRLAVYRLIRNIYQVSEEYKKAYGEYYNEYLIFNNIYYKAKMATWALSKGLLDEAYENYNDILELDPLNRCAIVGLSLVDASKNKKIINDSIFDIMMCYPTVLSVSELIKLRNNNDLETSLELFDLMLQLYPSDFPVRFSYYSLLAERGTKEDIDKAYSGYMVILQEEFNSNEFSKFNKAAFATLLMCIKYDREDDSNAVLDLYDKFNTYNKKQLKFLKKDKQRFIKYKKQLSELKSLLGKEEFYIYDEISELILEQNVFNILKQLKRIDIEVYKKYPILLKILKENRLNIIIMLLLKESLEIVDDNKFINSTCYKLFEWITPYGIQVRNNILTELSRGTMSHEEVATILGISKLSELVKHSLDDKNIHGKKLAIEVAFLISDNDLNVYKAVSYHNSSLNYDVAVNNLKILIECKEFNYGYSLIGKEYFKVGLWEESLENYNKYFKLQFNNYEINDVITLKFAYICELIIKSDLGIIDFEAYRLDVLIKAINLMLKIPEITSYVDKLKEICSKEENSKYLNIIIGINLVSLKQYEAAYERFNHIKSIDELGYVYLVNFLNRKMNENGYEGLFKTTVLNEICELNIVYGVIDDSELNEDNIVLNIEENATKIIKRHKDTDEKDRSEDENTLKIDINQFNSEEFKRLNDVSSKVIKVAPDLWKNFINYKYTDDRSVFIVREEIKSMLNACGPKDLDKKAELLLKRAKLNYKEKESDDFVKSMILYGVLKASAVQNKYNLDAIKYSFEVMRIVSEFDFNIELINGALKTFLSSIVNFENINEIVMNSEKIRWIKDNVAEFSTIKGIRDLFTNLVLAVKTIEKYETADEVEVKAQYRDRLFQITSQIREIEPPNDFKNIIIGIAISWKKLMEESSRNLSNEPNIVINFQNTSSKMSGSLFIEIINTGYGIAEDVEISLDVHGENVKVRKKEVVKLGDIRGKDKKDYEYEFRFAKEDDYEYELRVSYKNILGEEETISQQSVIKILGKSSSEEFIPVQNRYSPNAATKKEFFGRKEMLNKINETLQSDSDTVLVIKGMRRVGKTSILNYIKESNKEALVPIFIDMQNAHSVENTLTMVYDVILKTIKRELDERGIEMNLPSISEFERSPLVLMKDYLDTEIPKLIGDRKLVIMMDEFEYLLVLINKGCVNESILHTFRSMMQHSRYAKFVLAGADKLQEMLENYGSILFHIATMINVEELEKDEMIQMVTTTTPEVTFLDSSLEKLYKLTNGHPYYTKVICTGIIERRVNKDKRYIVYPADVDAVVKRIVESTSTEYFAHLWECDDVSKLIISFIAHKLNHPTDIVADTTIGDFCNTVPGCDKVRVLPSLTGLVSRGMLVEKTVKETKYYNFKTDLFRQWFKINKPVERTKAMEVNFNDNI